jgi:hypothetical protein
LWAWLIVVVVVAAVIVGVGQRGELQVVLLQR